MKVVFRADASARMGTGHLMRCLTLAEALREHGVDVGFICREYPGNLIGLLRQKELEVITLPNPANNGAAHSDDYAIWLGVTQAEDAEQTIRALEGEVPDWLVVDHYGLDVEWERRARPYVEHIMAIDDFPGRDHDCDVLLDQNYSVEGEQRYAGFIPPICKILLGPSYALLRKEFRLLRERNEARLNELGRILVFFTAGDDQGETLKAMQGIEMFGSAERVDVVVGYSNPDNAEIKARCDKLHWGYHCQVDYMPSLIAQADLVIGAGGSSNWERCALGVPALVAVLAENQALIAQALGNAGIVCNLGWSRSLQAADYANALNGLDHDRLAAMSARALALVDAKGAERVADIMLVV